MILIIKHCVITLQLIVTIKLSEVSGTGFCDCYDTRNKQR